MLVLHASVSVCACMCMDVSVYVHAYTCVNMLLWYVQVVLMVSMEMVANGNAPVVSLPSVRRTVADVFVMQDTLDRAALKVGSHRNRTRLV